jgi:hypothetical protein
LHHLLISLPYTAEGLQTATLKATFRITICVQEDQNKPGKQGAAVPTRAFWPGAQTRPWPKSCWGRPQAPLTRPHKLRILPLAASGKVQSLRCSSFPDTTHFVGLVPGRLRPLWGLLSHSRAASRDHQILLMLSGFFAFRRLCAERSEQASKNIFSDTGQRLKKCPLE